jgi:outer membrane protein assembly factor BamB
MTEMTNTGNNNQGPGKPLRLWPGVVAVALQWLFWSLVPRVAPDFTLVAFLGGAGGGLVVLVWWLFFSRAPWIERVGAVVLMIVGVFATFRIVHESIANGHMGVMLPIYSIPVLSLALVAWAIASRRVSGGLRLASMAGAILLACGGFTLVRTGGITGEADPDLHWRWTPTPEERLLAQARNEPVPPPSAPPAVETPGKLLPAPAGSEPTAPLSAAAPERRIPTEGAGAPTASTADPAVSKTEADWPGFRGPRRDGIVRGVRIETDWSRKPPIALWRRPVGPAWSSFAVHGDLVYTQEQRGDNEVVSCYRLPTGEPVWRHGDAVRFWESNAGAGPRATPTVSNRRVYTMGGTGIVNALDAGNGAVIWSRNAAADTGKKVPDWGFASSPLVVDDLVTVAVAGQLIAYDIRTGNPRWLGEAGGGGYSSPHFATIDGVPQILLLRGARTISVAPGDGTMLWEHSWQPAVSIVQPAVVSRDVLIAAGDAMGGTGIRCITAAHGPAGWTVEERWTSRGLKPYFNDMVVHKGHAFGFDGSILACIDLNDGTRKWKGGRYGHGQLVLLPDQDLLLLLSEDGELALVRAAPDQFTELARLPALNSKTWNHPVLVGDVLLVRNGEEMAAFRLSLAGP